MGCYLHYCMTIHLHCLPDPGAAAAAHAHRQGAGHYSGLLQQPDRGARGANGSHWCCSRCSADTCPVRCVVCERTICDHQMMSHIRRQQRRGHGGHNAQHMTLIITNPPVLPLRRCRSSRHPPLKKTAIKTIHPHTHPRRQRCTTTSTIVQQRRRRRLLAVVKRPRRGKMAGSTLRKSVCSIVSGRCCQQWLGRWCPTRTSGSLSALALLRGWRCVVSVWLGCT